ncbi:MAG: SH3 domain-containing C40 family peptidase [Pyrinomonadaceae bacterium]
MSKMKVNASGLNLRSAPVTEPGNIILVLPRGHEVEALDDAHGQVFREVETVVSGTTRRGFAAARFLREAMSEQRERLIQGALTEWNRFNRGTGKETIEPFTSRVGDYWQAIGENLDGDDVGVPWSAAFISFIMREARYTNFMFSPAHSKYIRDSKRKRNDGDENAPFWLFRLEEHKPEVGDMICQWRLSPRTFDDLPANFASHCDVIVEIDGGIAKAIGGNVGNSVSRTDFSLNDRGFIRPQRNVFAVMRNNK